MRTFNDYLKTYQSLLQQGDLKEAYQGLMQYLNDLRNHFKKEYPSYNVSGNVYQGTMHISFFTLQPSPIKEQRLKIVVVFIHEQLCFEVWLAGGNRQIQQKYWEIFAGSDFNKYRIPQNVKEGYSILEHTIVAEPDFDNLPKLTSRIEDEVIRFIIDIGEVLS